MQVVLMFIVVPNCELKTLTQETNRNRFEESPMTLESSYQLDWVQEQNN